MLDENGKAKFADFGSAVILKENDLFSDVVGTQYFQAPECCDPEIKQYSGKAADIWALGVTLYSLLFNKLPFWGESDIEIL